MRSTDSGTGWTFTTATRAAPSASLFPTEASRVQAHRASSDTATGNPKSDLKDVQVLTFLSPGVWQRRDIAKPVGEGVYELKINVPEAGVYMLFVESPSMSVRYTDLPYLMLHAAE